MSKVPAKVIRVKKPESYGPAMVALPSQKQREFVLHFIVGGKRPVEAARLAGYGKGSTPHSVNAIAQDLLQKPLIIEAMAEVGKKHLRSILPDALTAVEQIVTDRGHKDRAKVALNIINRIDPETTHVKIDATVTHKNADDEALQMLKTMIGLNVPREKMEELLGFTDLPRLEHLLAQQDSIEGECIDVTPEPEDEPDILDAIDQ